MSYVKPETLKRIADDISREAGKAGVSPVNRAFVNAFLLGHYPEARLDEIAAGVLMTGKTLQTFLADEVNGLRHFRKR